MAGRVAAHVVWRDHATAAFLDHRPLFPGHVLVVPVAHHETLTDLPRADVGELFGVVHHLAGAVERSCRAQGSFVAVNNRVSQSVPHLHVHVVPRTRGDGLRGFFWPRTRYADEAEMAATAAAIAAEARPPGSAATPRHPDPA